ncbi:MAG: transposase [Anaerolineales bacterium]|nr:transposase [Anaerolineales bacterium]
MGLAQGQKKWRDLKATLLLTDEAGFSLVSPLKRSWSPRGQTPTSRTSLNHHQRINLLGALLVSPTSRKLRLSVRSFQCNLRSEHVILLLKQVLRLASGDIILVWYNHKIHASPQTQEFIEDHPRMHEYRFPICAPELNPVEFVWTQVSEHTVGFASHNIQELHSRVQAGVTRTRSSKDRLLACLKTSDLSWK